MKPSTFLGLVVVIVAAFVFGQCLGVAKARVDQEADSLRIVLEDSVPAWIALAERQAVAVVETTIVIHERIVVDVAAADSAARVASTGAAALRAELTMVHRARLDSIVTSFEAAIADLGRALDRANRIIGLERSQKETEQALNVQLQAVLGETERQWERARRRNKTCGLGGSLGFGGTLSGGTVYTGPSATLGISCRVALPFP